MAGYSGHRQPLRHAYDMLDAALIWKVYEDDLPPLRSYVSQTRRPRVRVNLTVRG